MRRRYALDIQQQREEIQKDLTQQIKKKHIGNNVEFDGKKLMIDGKEYSYFVNYANLNQKLYDYVSNMIKTLCTGLNKENINSLQEILLDQKMKIIEYIEKNFVNEIKVNKHYMYIMEVVK